MQRGKSSTANSSDCSRNAPAYATVHFVARTAALLAGVETAALENSARHPGIDHTLSIVWHYWSCSEN
jgi:hypothetical protein